MRDFRIVLGWIFGVESFLCLWIAFGHSLYAFHRQHGFLTLQNWLNCVFFLALSIIFGVASWKVLRKSRGRKLWGTIASLAFVMAYLQPIIFFSKFVWWHSLGDLLIGLVGFGAFACRNTET